MATRPCFLVIEREYPGNISARKLVIETAKLNVITCYSLAEAIATLRRFPGVDGIVLSAEVKDMPCADAARELKSIAPRTPLVVISPNAHESCDHADHRLSSHDPQALLEVLKQLSPRAA
jgi:response regulator RpfG family c-di-GMP phosphodiesterase